MPTARRERPTGRAPMLLVAGATAFGCWLRATDLAATPPEMTSDHVEKLLDAWRVLEGTHTVFFAGNGGREALQMYIVAWLAGPLGLGFTFDTLKWATIVEGVVSVPALAWMAGQIVGTERAEDRQLGAWVGAAIAWLVAVSSWHVMLSRLGLRIVLTPLVTALAIGAAARVARSRRLLPAMALGAVLGAGVYTYQAARLLPVAVLAPLVQARRWRAVTLAVGVAMLVATPMLRYSQAHPEAFWHRVESRVSGDGAVARTAGGGGEGEGRWQAWRERAADVWARRDVFIDNYGRALAMYHQRGDRAWINNAGSRPALDPVTGVLALIGLGAWAAALRQRRDAAWWLPPVSVAVMLLPSALVLAYPDENPSFTRASGTLPGVYFLAALPLGWILWRVSAEGQPRNTWPGAVAASVVLLGVAGVAYPWNRDNYFTDYRLSYQRQWRPYGEIARPLRTFLDSGGRLGNAFVVAYPHWLDHRILGARAGDLLWPNGLASRTDLPAAIARNAGTRYAFDPGGPVFVMLHPADGDTAVYLRQRFAGGEIREVSYRWPDGSDDGIGTLRVFTAPAGSIRETVP